MIFLRDRFEGEYVKSKKTYLSQIKNFFGNHESLAEDKLVYQVDYCESSGEGALNFGISRLFSGDLNDEFFMTKGHVHKNKNKDEIYWGISGNGLLILIEENRSYRIDEVCEGSFHYIKGNQTHRLVNVGDVVLNVGACWHADSGYDYTIVEEKGFPVRIFKQKGSYEVRENEE